MLSITAKEVYEAFRKFPGMEPQKTIQRVQKKAIAHSFGLMVSAFNPLDVIVVIGSLAVNNQKELLEPAERLYRRDKGNYQLHTLNVPKIVTTKLPEIGVQGAAAYFHYQGG